MLKIVLELLQRSGYNLGLSTLPPVHAAARANEEERKRQEHQQRLARSDLREREKISTLNTFLPYPAHSVQVSVRYLGTSNLSARYYSFYSVLTHALA